MAPVSGAIENGRLWTAFVIVPDRLAQLLVRRHLLPCIIITLRLVLLLAMLVHALVTKERPAREFDATLRLESLLGPLAQLVSVPAQLEHIQWRRHRIDVGVRDAHQALEEHVLLGRPLAHTLADARRGQQTEGAQDEEWAEWLPRLTHACTPQRSWP